MFLTGARIVEPHVGDVDLSRRKVLIRQTKIGAERRARLRQGRLGILRSTAL
jgi:hypothetical protein